MSKRLRNPRSKARKLAFVISLFALGLLVGPLIMGVGAGLFASADMEMRWRDAYQILVTHRERFPKPLVMYSIDWSATIKDCGYDPQKLFGENPDLKNRPEWNPYSGYFDLMMAESFEFTRQTNIAQAEELQQTLTAFELAFLKTCLTRSFIASPCAARVESVWERAGMTNGWPRGRTGPDTSRQNKTTCVYLDGLAAHRGIPLRQRAL